MNPARYILFARWRRWLLGLAAAGLVVTAALGLRAPGALVPAYRFVGFVCLAPAIGSLLFALIHRSTGGRWGEALRPFLAAGSAIAPWLWLLVLPLVLVGPMRDAAWPAYYSRGMMLARGVVYAVVLFVIARRLRDAGEDAPAIGPVGLIVLVFALHLLSDDWLGLLDPGWYSTAFPLVWMVGMAVAGLAVAVLAALAAGLSPEAPFAPRRRLGLDWGNLLLAGLIFWTYVAFAQFLIIWAGNMPAETSWYLRRTTGSWAIVPATLAIVNFAVPFALLLSRSFKRSPRMLAAVAVILLAGQVIYIAWLILPAFPWPGLAGAALPLAALVGTAALFGWCYLAAVERRLTLP